MRWGKHFASFPEEKQTFLRDSIGVDSVYSMRLFFPGNQSWSRHRKGVRGKLGVLGGDGHAELE